MLNKTLVQTLKDAFLLLDLSLVDWPAMDLALRYAEEIDNGDRRTLRSLGPELLRVLVELKMTPKARQEIKNRIEVVPDGAASFSDFRSSARSRYPDQ